MGLAEASSGKQNGEIRTVCDDATEGGSLEVKLNIHVFSLQRPGRETLFPPLITLHHPERAGGTFLPLSPPLPLLPDRGDRRSLTNREELLLRMVLALPKAAEMRRGAVRWLRGEEGL